MGTRLPAQLARRLRANSVFKVSPDDAVAEAVLQNPAWRRVVLVGTVAAIVAFALGFMAEPSGTGTPDRTIYGLAAGARGTGQKRGLMGGGTTSRLMAIRLNGGF